MDNNCVFIDKFANWVSSCPNPPICYAALQRTRSFNTPTAIVGLSLQALGDYGEWCINGKPCQLPVNHLAIGCSHGGSASPEPEGDVEFWSIAFDMTGISDFDYLWTNPEREVTAVNNPTRLIAAFHKVVTRFAIPYEPDSLYLKAALLDLFAVAKSEFHRIPERKTRPETIDKALEWMGKNFYKPGITLGNMSEATGLNVFHFGRIFNTSMGKSPMRYLRELRIHHSCGLLKGTALRINEIAFAVGFRDPLHYSRVFHTVTGKSPSAFRKNPVSF